MDGNKEIHRYVILSIIPGFGVVSRNRLINMCGNIEDCFERTVGELVHMDQKDEKRSRIGEKKLTIFFRTKELTAYHRQRTQDSGSMPG